MGALPKRKYAKARQGKRRNHIKINAMMWLSALSVITPGCRIMFALPAAPTMAGKSSRLKGREEGRASLTSLPPNTPYRFSLSTLNHLTESALNLKTEVKGN